MGVNGIYGLSGSGLDIESMVKVGMMSKQNEYDKMAQKYTKNEWMKSAYIELSSSISSFNLTKLSDYKMSSSMSAKSASSTSDAVKATANGSAEFRTHSVEVTNLVSNASLVGTNKMTRYDITGTTEDDKFKLANVLFQTLKQDGDYVYGTIANVDMADNSRDYAGTSISDGSKPRTFYTFGTETLTEDFTNVNWDDTNSRLVTAADNGFYSDSVTWQYDTNEWNYDSGTGSWTKYNSNTGIWENATPEFATVTWNSDTSRYETNNGLYVSNVTWNNDDTEWVKSGSTYTKNVASQQVSTGSDAFAFTISDGAGNSADISFTYDELLGLNGETAATFYDFADKINNAGLNIKASYDADYDRFSFYNTEDGSGNNIELTFESMGSKGDARANLVARNFFDNMGLYQSVNGTLIGENESESTETDSNYLLFKLGSTANKIEGKDATIRIDGLSYNSKDNKITKDGITYEAVDTTSAPARVSVSQDVDAIVDKVKSFVEDYNKLLSSLYEKYDEKPDSNYKPLTQAQKDAMKDEQVEKWEAKAKKGILYHDQTLSKIILNMRNAVSNQVELDDGTTTSAYSIGISTVAGNIKGQLTLDENKLRAALADNPDSVYKVFANLDPDDMNNDAKNGIAQRLGDVFTAATKSIKTRAGTSTDVTEDSDLNNLLRQLQTKMSNFKKMMDAFEDKLYKKYDTMESTLAKLGTQLNYISSTGQ